MPSYNLTKHQASFAESKLKYNTLEQLKKSAMERLRLLTEIYNEQILLILSREYWFTKFWS